MKTQLFLSRKDGHITSCRFSRRCHGFLGGLREPWECPGGPGSDSSPALYFHYQCCPHQPQCHLDGHSSRQCQPTWAGTSVPSCAASRILIFPKEAGRKSSRVHVWFLEKGGTFSVCRLCCFKSYSCIKLTIRRDFLEKLTDVKEIFLRILGRNPEFHF